MLILVIVLLFAIRTSPFQNFLADEATAFLSKELNAKIEIDKLDIIFFDRVDLVGVYLEDQHQDTLGYIESVDVEIGQFNLAQKYFYLDEVTITKPVYALVKHKGDSVLNLKFLTDYFKSESTDTTKSNFDFQIHSIVLDDGRFKFWDENASVSEKGMDFSHLNLSSINAQFSDFKIAGDSILVNVNKLSANERSGFELNQLASNVVVSPKGIVLDDVLIETPRSSISTKKLAMLTNSYEDYSDYINKVSYHSTLNKSNVALSDVAYFAPILWGSDEIITISSRVDNPITKMKFKDLNLNIGKKLSMKANLSMPDFTDFNGTDLYAKINHLNTSFNDIESLDLPDAISKEPLRFSDQIKSLGTLDLKNVELTGSIKEFVLKADDLKTSLGGVSLKNGITFTYDESLKMYVFGRNATDSYDLMVDNFDLGKFLNNDMFGLVSGKIAVSGSGLTPEDLNVNVAGDVDQFQMNGYDYQNIKLKNGKITTKSFEGELTIDDPNLKLDFDGSIDFTSQQIADFELNVDKANLSNLGFVDRDSMEISFKTKMNTKHFDPDKIDGRIAIYDLLLQDGSKEFVSDSLILEIERTPEKDNIDIISDVLEGEIDGKFYSKTFVPTLIHEIASVFPSFFDEEYYNHLEEESDFSYNLVFHDKINDLLDVFVPGLSLSEKTKLEGNYNGDLDELDFFYVSDSMTYNGITFYEIDLYNQIGDSSIFIDNQISKIVINDSLSFDDFSIHADGRKDSLDAIFKWGDLSDLKTHPGIISLTGVVESKEDFKVLVNPSFFYMKRHKWELSDEGEIALRNKVLDFDKLRVNFKNQYIAINGKLSEEREHKTIVEINDFELAEINNLFGGKLDVQGLLNGKTEIASPTKDLFLEGNFDLASLQLDKYEIGDVKIKQEWNDSLKSFALEGGLTKDSNERLSFDGQYYTKRKKDNLDLNLNFDYTDVSFVNALLPTDAINNIRGLLYGNLRAHGSFSDLLIEGEIDLFGGNVKVDMLGVNFGLAGKVTFDEYGIMLEKMPVFDQDGNASYLTGAIYHDNFTDWNCNVDLNLEDNYFETVPNEHWNHLPLDRFLLMDAEFKEGAAFYGKAYGTGLVNVFFYKNHLELDVAVQTKEGTDVFLPIFSSGDLEEDDFIVFENKDTTDNKNEDELDLSGVSLNLNFDVNEDARIHLILDEAEANTLDAVGNGYIQIGLNQLNDLSMSGEYFVTQGDFNLNLAGVVSKNFSIQEGGTVTWSGSPYDAILDVTANYVTSASIFEASPNLLEDGGHKGRSQVNCGVVLKESLMKPAIGFDITSENATESEKSILNRIKSDEDELNRQFFSLLLWNRFQPLDGTNGANASGALGDIVSGQLNKLLDQASENFKLGVDINSSDDLSHGDVRINTEFDLDKNDRLTLKTSFGYANNLVGEKHVSSLIGDVSLEYKLNKQGTFRVKVFNESNDYNVIQDKNLGGFTQGVGLFYTESFNSVNDFKLVQHFLNIFRKEGKKKKLNPDKEKRKVPIPEDKKYLLEEYERKKKGK